MQVNGIACQPRAASGDTRSVLGKSCREAAFVTTRDASKMAALPAVSYAGVALQKA